ncbi:MAG TPA: hypothetical protein VH835_15520 [Dongiaceae bacterium]|jgi:hypothetical protein
MTVLYAVGAYLAAGLVVAIGFVSLGLQRVLAEPRQATAGARIILVPGAALLWPYIAYRLLRSARPS